MADRMGPMTEKEAMTLILYYGREGFVRHVGKVCQAMLARRGEEPVFRFWYAFSVANEGNVGEALREYNKALGHGPVRRIQIAVCAAKIYAHRSMPRIDQAAVDSLRNDMMMVEADASDGAKLQLAAFYWLVGDHEQAREWASKAVEHSDEFLSGHGLMGWIHLTSGRSAHIEKSSADFQKALDPAHGGSKHDIDAALGRAAYLQRKQMHPEAIEQLNQLIAACKSDEVFKPITIEKAKVLIEHNDWDQAADCVQRLLHKDKDNVQALMLIVLYLLVIECRFTVAAHNLQELSRALDIHEPKTHRLYYFVTKTLARLSGSNQQVLQATNALITRACDLMPSSSEYQTERGYQLSLVGEWQKSLDAYRQASQLDEGNIQALNGIIRADLMLGKLDDAEQQLNFLNEIQVSMGRTAELCYLFALLKWRKHKDQEASIKFLKEAVDIHQKDCQGRLPSYDFFEKFNPHFLLQIIREYLQHCPTEPVSPTDPPSTVTQLTRKPLELLREHVPGSLEGMLLLARIDFIQNDLERAQASINHAIRTDTTFAEAHLLAAQIAYHQECFPQAQQALEQAMAEFEVRELPQFSLLKARLAAEQGHYEEAQKDLTSALGLTKQIAQGKRYRPLNVQDHVAIYLELAQVHLKQRQVQEAEAVINEAMHQFRTTKEEGRVVIAQAMIVAKKDVDSALGKLRSIPRDSPYFLKAKAQMAHIHLNLRNNKRAFAKCYEELVDAYPTTGSYLFLGEAYMSIQEPEKAIAAFKKARQMDQSDAEMAVKIGRAHVTTHDYKEAISYYKGAVQAEPGKLSLRHDLANLYWRLGNHQDAEAELQASLQVRGDSRSNEDLQTVQDNVKTMLLLAKVHKSAEEYKKASEALIKARVYQNTVLSKIRTEQPETVYHQRTVAANICYELGEYYREQKQLDRAVMFHNDALKQDETHQAAMLALAKLYRDKGELEGCELQANSLLRVDPANEEASMMLADLMFRKNKYEDATYHFQQLLEKKPGNYDALVLFIQLLRRSGRLFEAPRFLKAAEKAQRSRIDPGLHHAKGLYHRYTNNPRDALREFNQGKHPRDTAWSEKCTINMIEIYLNPDQENPWSEPADGEERRENSENTQWANKLLQELRDQNSSDKQRRRILEAYVMIREGATMRKKDELEKALATFYDIMMGDQSGGAPAGDAAAEKVNVPCLVGMATALQIMKQTPKARNHLRRVAKAPFTQEEAEDFERGWLLLSDIYIQGGKYDLAQELLKKCLQANKSCCRAWEFMGLIYEKEQSYRDAADCYENAWRLVNESAPDIGYKLAFNYLKAKRYVNAIDVTQKVLSSHPQYPKIRKDILDKARSSLRP
eukprot:TRINITY_DN35779_c0_g1_i1.p1 TRINITY_DN35779_c0_g1~~TRINITY_DN35779_c0_g1_i1.p1  ORF type:complete len:1373 (+),score=488.22 TRINITY_DN35779_c0_g1_i1:98-4120(+)